MGAVSRRQERPARHLQASSRRKWTRAPSPSARSRSIARCYPDDVLRAALHHWSDLATGRIPHRLRGARCLAGIPSAACVPPAEFIPVAKTVLINTRFGGLMLRAHAMDAPFARHVRVAVNLFAVLQVSRVGNLSLGDGALQRSGRRQRLELESPRPCCWKKSTQVLATLHMRCARSVASRWTISGSAPAIQPELPPKKNPAQFPVRPHQERPVLLRDLAATRDSQGENRALRSSSSWQWPGRHDHRRRRRYQSRA